MLGVLAFGVEQPGAAVEPLDDVLGDRAVVAEPDRSGEHRDVRGHHPLVQRGPLVRREPVLGHVRIHAGGEVVVDGPDLGGGDTAPGNVTLSGDPHPQRLGRSALVVGHEEHVPAGRDQVAVPRDGDLDAFGWAAS